MRRSDDFPMRYGGGRGMSRRPEGFGEPFGSFGGSPWQMMRRMQEDMDRLFEQFFGAPGGVGTEGGFGPQTGRMAQLGQRWAPSVDVSQSDREWCVEIDLPGVRQDDIDVQVHNDHLHVRAEMRQGDEQSQEQNGQSRQYLQRERRFGFFERVMPLPPDVDEENVSCEFRDGVLTLHLPRTQQSQQQPRRIPITGESTQGQLTGSGGTSRGAQSGGGWGSSGQTDQPGQTGQTGRSTQAGFGGAGTGGQGAPGGRSMNVEEDRSAMAGAKGGATGESTGESSGAAGETAGGAAGAGRGRAADAGKGASGASRSRKKTA